MKKRFSLFALLLVSASAFASSDAAWQALYERTEKACVKKSALKDAHAVGERVVFSKAILYRIEGTYPQPHMNAQKGTVYCLHPYPKGRAEIAESP